MTWGEAAFAVGSRTHCDSDWQLMTGFSPGSQGVTVNHHPLEFKLGKSRRAGYIQRSVVVVVAVVLEFLNRRGLFDFLTMIQS